MHDPEASLNLYRPSWDNTWLKVAWVMGDRSRCSLAQVGAVIVTADQKVASTGYNGPPAGREVRGPCSNWCPRAKEGTIRGTDYSTCESIHAETNALLRADHSAIRGGTIYVSRACCINCARMVANSGAVRLVHAVRNDDIHRDPASVRSMLESCGIDVVEARYDTLGYPPRV